MGHPHWPNYSEREKEDNYESQVRLPTDDRQFGGVFVLSGDVLGDAGVLAGVVGLHGANAEEDRVFVDREDGDARLGADGTALVPPVDADGRVALDHLARHRHRLALAQGVRAERERLDSRRHLQNPKNQVARTDGFTQQQQRVWKNEKKKHIESNI